MLGLYDKNELFSERMLEVEKLLQLFLAVIEFRHLDLFIKWLKVVEKYIVNQNNQEMAADIINFLLSMPNEHR
jgi:hypothetical protein